MNVSMTGRNAIVTGASMGLGRAIAHRFAEAGAAVAMVARREGPLEEARAAIAAETGARVVAVPGDVSDAAGCEAVIAAAQAALGDIDVLVNNAGSSARAPFDQVTDAMWQADLDLKLFGAIRLTRALFPGMKQRRWGRVINVLNTGAKAPPAEGAPTAVSRAAGLALTKVLAGEGAAHNVLVNALLVGKIDSDQWRRRHAAENRGRSYEEYMAEAGKVLPMGRMGRAEEFADAACFLASDRASYINGTAINVDGGLCPVV
ncbi:MAG: SDR family oxidoreductase [Ectothiorhodospiraceae bacterium]|nr:SDR family oxidoreductase [Chromatiales bacterium]MCP5157063.1 SDR family oxidoreductase [Ectothiorhodospiraceae bacterium]